MDEMIFPLKGLGFDDIFLPIDWCLPQQYSIDVWVNRGNL